MLQVMRRPVMQKPQKNQNIAARMASHRSPILAGQHRLAATAAREPTPTTMPPQNLSSPGPEETYTKAKVPSSVTPTRSARSVKLPSDPGLRR